MRTDMDGFDFSGGIPVPVNLETEDMGQDVNDQVWESVLPDPTGSEDPNDDRNMHDLNRQTEIRTNSGVLDLLHSVTDGIDWTHQEYSGQHGRRTAPVHKPIDTRTVKGNFTRCQTWYVGGPSQPGVTKCAENRPHRTRLTVLNSGVAILYLSHDSAVVGGQNVFALPVNASVVIESTAELWGVAAVATVQQTFSTIEEFYEPDRD